MVKPVLRVGYFHDTAESWIASFTRPIKGLRTTHFFRMTPASKKRLTALNIPWSDSSLGKKFDTPAAALFEQSVELSGHLEDMIRNNERLRAENIKLKDENERLRDRLIASLEETQKELRYMQEQRDTAQGRVALMQSTSESYAMGKHFMSSQLLPALNKQEAELAAAWLALDDAGIPDTFPDGRKYTLAERIGRLQTQNLILGAKVEALKSFEFVTDDLSMYCPWCWANDLGHAGKVTHASDCPRKED